MTIVIDYTPPPDFVRTSENDYRVGSGPINIICNVEGATGPSATCGLPPAVTALLRGAHTEKLAYCTSDLTLVAPTHALSLTVMVVRPEARAL